MMRQILFVDDDKYFEYIIHELLTDPEMPEVTFSYDVPSAISYLKSLRHEKLPALIVTDFNLPTINGVEFLKILKSSKNFAEIDVVVLTNYMSPTEKAEIIKAGALRIFEKSHKLDELERLLISLKEIVLKDAPQPS